MLMCGNAAECCCQCVALFTLRVHVQCAPLLMLSCTVWMQDKHRAVHMVCKPKQVLVCAVLPVHTTP